MIYKYLLEIKYRCFFTFITWCFLMANCYYFKETLLYVFMRSSFKSNQNNLIYFLTTDIVEVFVAYVQLSSYISNQITTIFLLYQTFLFLSTGLYRFEYEYLRLVLLTISFCWATCVFMVNNFIFSISWDFFLRFQQYLSFQNLAFHFEIKLSEYLLFYKYIYYLCHLTFQVVILFFIFVDLFRTNISIIKRLRKFLFFLFFILSTLVTPPEVLYQLVMSVCTIFIYESVIFYTIFKTELETFT